ncbi:MAG: hypothetical protein HC925_05325 [Coleofasciculaceae cyanobacterium SM2_3_26]|nr:hypothetical protein [Coleofasciculaceae cyanobacterium SM2_3_26]
MQLNALTETLQQERQVMTALEQQFSILTQEKTALNEQLQQQSATASTLLSQWEQQVDALNAELSREKEQQVAAAQQATDLAGEKERLEMALQQRQEAIAALEQQVSCPG